MPDYATKKPHATSPEANAYQYVAVNRWVKFGQVTICEAPSHEKAKKLARLFNVAPRMADALSAADRVLFLLAGEVERLGFKAGKVPVKVKTALGMWRAV